MDLKDVFQGGVYSKGNSMQTTVFSEYFSAMSNENENELIIIDAGCGACISPPLPLQ